MLSQPPSLLAERHLDYTGTASVILLIASAASLILNPSIFKQGNYPISSDTLWNINISTPLAGGMLGYSKKMNSPNQSAYFSDSGIVLPFYGQEKGSDYNADSIKFQNNWRSYSGWIELEIDRPAALH